MAFPKFGPTSFNLIGAGLACDPTLHNGRSLAQGKSAATILRIMPRDIEFDKREACW
jgi:hypothetical protein